jgi:hypothetical protein
MAVMKNKAISFNLNNCKDKQLLDHIEGITNFSAYIKMLIEGDMRKTKIIVEVGKK